MFIGHTRQKRDSPYLAERTTCHLMVVADYTFYKHVGGDSAANTALYLVSYTPYNYQLYTQNEAGPF